MPDEKLTQKEQERKAREAAAMRENLKKRKKFQKAQLNRTDAQ